MRQMKIGKRFSLTASLLLALMVVLGAGSLVSINSLGKSVDTVVTDPLPPESTASLKWIP